MGSLLYILICSCRVKYLVKPPLTQIEPKIIISTNDVIEKIISKEFLFKFIKYNVHSKALCKVISHICWENEVISETISKIFLEIISFHDMHSLKYIFEIIQNLLSLEDQIQLKRIKYFLSNFIDQLNNKKDINEEIPYIRECIRQLQNLANLNKNITKWLRKNESKWQWITKWYEKTKAYNNIIKK